MLPGLPKTAIVPVIDVTQPASPSKPRLSRRGTAGAAKRAAILDAGLHVFANYGLHGASIDRIAERAEVSKTNLLYYFPNKEALYVGVLRRLLDLWLAPLRAMQADDDPRQAIERYIRQKLVFSRDCPEASRLFCIEVAQGGALLNQEFQGAMRELTDAKAAVVRRWISAGRLAPVDPRHLLFALWATTQHYADFAAQVSALTGRSLAEPAFLDETVANVQAILLDGVMPRPAPP